MKSLSKRIEKKLEIRRKKPDKVESKFEVNILRIDTQSKFDESLKWNVKFEMFPISGASASPNPRHSHAAANSPRPELTTMTNVNVLDLQMNPQPTALQQSGLPRETDDEHKKSARAESYEENESISW